LLRLNLQAVPTGLITQMPAMFLRDFRPFLLLFSTCLYISCTDRQQTEQHAYSSPQPVSGIRPGTDTLKPALKVWLDTCPRPLVFQLPGNSKKTEGIPVPAPLIATASPIITMPNYNTEHGLALSSVTCGMRDSKGNLWFGTQGGGVSRYDGRNFTTFSNAEGLSNNTVWCIYEDREGNIWFGTQQGGASRYDGRSFTNFSTKNGLGTNNIWCIGEDSQGVLWLGTLGGGLSMYIPSLQNAKTGSAENSRSKDMQKVFRSVSTDKGLPSASVYCMTKDKKGDLWFGTIRGGICHYQPSRVKADGSGGFTTYNTSNGLANNTVRCCLKDKKGNLWFGTIGGVSMFDPEKNRFTNFSTEQGLASNNILSIAEDRQGNIWMGTNGMGLSCYTPGIPNPEEGTFRNYTTAEGLANNLVLSITEDRTGNLWFGTGGGGLSRFDGKSLELFNLSNSQVANLVWDIKESQEGNIWFSAVGGLYQYVPLEEHPRAIKHLQSMSFTCYTEAQGLGDNFIVNTTEDAKGRMWLSTNGGGISVFDRFAGTFTQLTVKQGLTSNIVVNSLRTRKGSLWFVMLNQGLNRYDPPKTGKALYEGSFTKYTSSQGLASNAIVALEEDLKGMIWLGGEKGMLSCFDPNAETETRESSGHKKCPFTNYGPAQGLPPNTILSILADERGAVWFGTEGGGLCRFDGKSFLPFTPAQGLGDAIVTAVKAGPHGVFFLGTNSGISVFKGFRLPVKADGVKQVISLATANDLTNDALKKYEPVFEVYNDKTGYSIKDVNTHALCCDSKGVVWAGTGDKLVRFDYKEVKKDTLPLELCFRSVKINNENISWYDLLHESDTIGSHSDGTQISAAAAEEVLVFSSVLSDSAKKSMRNRFGDIRFSGVSRFYPIPIQLELPYRHNNISFDFAAVEPAKPSLVKYQYYLEGYDNTWSPLTANSTASFGNIQEGRYIFRLKALSPEGVWSKPLTYAFIVLPPWYRSWWAYLIYLLAGFTLISGFVNYRIRALRKEKALLKLKVEQRTSELKEQKEIVEEKQNKILSSIAYAKRIQSAVLKEEEYVSKHLPEHFILFKPKDIVSGDFYWSFEKQRYWYVAAVDCTGHGVPGAFLSMLGVSFLNEINSTPEILNPAEVLNQLREKMVHELCQTGTVVENKDGMDISLLRLQLDTLEAEWAGAYNPLIFIDPAGSQRKVNADRQPIGYYPEPKPFTNHKVQLAPGTTIYLFTDGYADQQNENRERISKKRFFGLLKSNATSSVGDQKEALQTYLGVWQGNCAQTDDICVIGIRI
jgi:ligand-binding sensor domain-containing protein/serine phosphatase RsbU (regulator of sigma subunit)